MDHIEFTSMPVLCWDAMLYITKLKIELISDPFMSIFFGKGMRKGVCYIYNRYSKASNKYLKSYHPKQESKHNKFLGTNNLVTQGLSFVRQITPNG